MKRRRLLVVTVLVTGLCAAVAWQAMRPKAPTKVLSAKVERLARLRSIVSATGEVRAKEFVDIQAEVDGVIVELRVREGDTVQQGDVLLRLEDLQLRAAEDQAKAQLGAAEADAQNAEVGIATAEANLAAERTALANVKVEVVQARITRDRSRASFQRKQELFGQQLIGSEEFEIARAEADLAEQRLSWNEARVAQSESNLHAVESRIAAARAVRDAACRRVDAARATLVGATDRVGKTVLRAPLSGLITRLNVEKGERAVPGIQSNPIATLMTIADMSIVEAEVRVDEADIVTVQLGAVAEVEVDALRDVKLAGTVTEIGQSPIETAGGNGAQNQEGKEFKVVVRLEAPPASLRPGLTATADIVTAVREDCLVVPLQALTAREVEVDEGGRYVPGPEPKPGEERAPPTAAQRQRMKELEGVFVLRDGRARFRPVGTGITGDMDIEVLEGLQEGEEVVRGPYQVLRTIRDHDPAVVDVERQEDAQRLLRRRP